MTDRIKQKFLSLKEQKRSALITYVMAYDKSYDESLELLHSLPEAGADIIELGMPFSDPMADGPTIQEAAIRALAAGAKLSGILEMVAKFRQKNSDTPIILMGYYNPVQHYGIDKFCKDAKASGVDGLLIVDLPPEEDERLYISAQQSNLALIKLATPTTDDARLQKILQHAGGFLYYVAVAGITGTKSASYDSIGNAVSNIKKHTDIPVAVGFGIKTAADVKAVGQHADAVVVGSSLVKIIAEKGNKAAAEFVRELRG